MDNWDDAVAGVLHQDTQATAAQIRANLTGSLGTNPDQEATLRRAASATGIPLPTARAAPEQVQTQAAVQSVDATGLGQRFPNLGQFLTNPDNTRLVHDDIPATAAIEQHVQALGGAPKAPAGPPGAFLDPVAPTYRDKLSELVRGWFGMGPAEPQRDEAGAARANIDLAAKGAGQSRGEFIDAAGGNNALVQAHDWAQQFFSGAADSATAGLAPAAAGAPDTTGTGVAHGAGELAGFLLGLPVKAGTEAVGLTGKLLERTVGESFVKGMAKDVTRQAATLGIASGVQATGAALDQSTPQGAVDTVLRAAGAGAATGATFGVAGRLLPDSTIAQGILRFLGVSATQDALSGQTPWDNRPVEQKVFDYGLNAFFTMHGAGRAGGGWLYDAARADTAIADSQVLGGLSAAAAASKLRERDPDLFKQFVASAAQDGPVPAVYVDGKQLAEALHQSGIGTDEIAEKMPALEKGLVDALATGGQVRIPVEDFATHIAGGKLEQALLPHLRTDPEGMSLSEAQAFYQSHTDELKAQAEKMAAESEANLPAQQSQQQVHDAVLAQLEATGRFRPEVNQAYAAMTRDFYTTMAQRAGVMPHELYAQHPLAIGAENIAGESLAQAPDGPFGPRFEQFKGDAAGAIEHLRSQQTGEAIGALHHPDVGDIDLPWGEAGTNNSDGYGLAKLEKWHPEVVGDLQGVLDKMTVTSRSANRVQLESADHKAAVRLQWDGEAKKWLLTAFKKGDGTDTRTDTVGLAGEGDSPTAVSESIVERKLDQFYQGARGAFSPDTSTISLLKGADLSTFLHESGHFYLDTLSKMASDPAAPEGIRADMALALKFMGHPEDVAAWRDLPLDQQREGHELFARAYEAYLLEGRAPSAELRGLFARFRSWLVNTYRSLTALNVELTPEVRGVFDRMLASEDAIRAAEQARAYMPLFNDPAKAEMTPEQWSAYQQLGASASEKALEELSAKTVRDMAWSDRVRSGALKDLAKDAAAKRKAVRTEVETEVDAQPVYAAMRFLKRGETGGTGDEPAHVAEVHRLDIGALKAMYPDGEVDWSKLGYGKYGMLGEKGLAPDLVADLHGFPSGDALVRSLLDAQPRRDVIRDMTEQRMLEKHGDIATPEALARAADDAVHNEVRTRFVATELAALDKARGPVRMIVQAAKEMAEKMISEKRVRDLSERDYLLAEARASKEAEKRLAAGDTVGAAVAKRDQLLHNALGRAARDAQAQVDKGLAYLKRFDRDSVRARIDVEYRDQIDALLDRFDLRTSVSGKALDKRASLLQFVEGRAAAGYEPNVPAKLLDEARRQHFKDMPFEDFSGLVDGVKSIEHLGLLKDKLLDLKEERSIAALAAEAKEAMATLPQHAPDSNRGLTRMASKWLNAKAAGRSVTSSLLKMEQLFDLLDARNPGGVFNRVIFRRIADAGIKQNDLAVRVKADIAAFAKEHVLDLDKDGARIYTAPSLLDKLTGQPQKFTRKEMLMLAGNMGNDSNVAKLTKGEGWQEQAVWEFLNGSMSKADWDFVAGMGRTLESLWPEKVAMSRRLGNTSPEKVAPRPFDTPHGRYEGWYWPMIYDPARAQDVAERGARAGDQLFENVYSQPKTDTGRLTTRVENYARPILLDLDALPRVIQDEIHDIAFREAVIDADRFLARSDVRDAIVNTTSQQHYDQLRPWLQAIANDGRSNTSDSRGMEWMNTVAREGRLRGTMVGLGLRLTTAAVHGLTAGTESVAELGPRWMASGLADFKNPLQWQANTDAIYERSGEMRHRSNEIERDVREHLREIDLAAMDPATSAAQRGANWIRARAYWLIGTLDLMSALPTWQGAYNKGLTPTERGGLGMGEEDAVYFADKTVRNAHGGGGVKDTARVQRGNEFQKLFTMYYSFWSHNVNRIMDTARLIGSPADRQALKAANNWSDSQLATTIVLRTLAYTIGVQAIHSLFNPHDKTEDESWLGWAAKEIGASAVAGVPIARDVYAHYVMGKDYNATPAAQMVAAFGQTGQDAAHALMGEQVSDKWLKHLITSSGYILNLPLGQPASTMQFMADVGTGKQDPQDAADWWRGITSGQAKKH